MLFFSGGTTKEELSSLKRLEENIPDFSVCCQWCNWDDFNVDIHQKSSWGSGGRCEPPQQGSGSAPEIFEIYGFFHLRGPILANFRELSGCFVAKVFSE